MEPLMQDTTEAELRKTHNLDVLLESPEVSFVRFTYGV